MSTTLKIDDGGPAFPMPAFSPGGTDHVGFSQAGFANTNQSGMTLRDWFAGQANENDIEYHQVFIQETPARGVIPPRLKSTYSREQARYRFADAMIAARNKASQ